MENSVGVAVGGGLRKKKLSKKIGIYGAYRGIIVIRVCSPLTTWVQPYWHYLVYMVLAADLMVTMVLVGTGGLDCSKLENYFPTADLRCNYYFSISRKPTLNLFWRYSNKQFTQIA